MSANQELTLPQMGCGTWAWGNQLLWGYNESMDDELQAVFNLCVSHGVTLFDTGDSYGTGRLQGRSEILLGRFSRAYQGVNQEHICIATKLAAYPWRWTRQSMIKACQASTQRLGRNVDLVQMHWSTANYAPWQEEGLLDGLADLYEQGLVKGVGLSNYGTKRLQRVHQKFAARGVPIKTLQVQYSLLSTYPVTHLGLKEVCDELGIQLIAYSPLALGILTGKYSEQGPFPKGIRGLLFRQLLPGVRSLLQCLRAVAESRNKTMSQVAINWCICKGTIPIPGAKSVTQAQSNIGALGWQLDAGEIAELDQAAASTDKKMVQNIFQTK
ncbi:putative oxidoreductase, aryl-alcohol dehydrogenase like protein [Nostoc sp. PCC 7524]|uniref:aldo/keto reductase n=1 Tax=Nostoc sp. (strain ATCC 29411 / PCC 7524) TaxID=28072 RepID=UPI00029EEC0F|nr:aldo/keto reductase [Nostoc sp. PCC 7524]AFY47033.1 putative oxidoreductase, aryl-alcohol dehydrogenase like protein [Nostoc sp. PCC 7524]